MANHAYVDLNIPEAALLADLAGIKSDFRDVLSFSSTLRAALDPSSRRGELVDPLTTAILVRYARPFMSGVRFTLNPNQISTFSAADVDCHESYISWRSKHISHSVNLFEDNQPTARFVSERVNEEGITDVTVQENRLIGLGSDDLNVLEDLCSKATAYVSDLYAAERERLLEIVRALSVEEVLSAGIAMRRPGLEEVGRSRPQNGGR